MPKFQLVLLIHAHQPVGNFEDVLERCLRAIVFAFRRSARAASLHSHRPALFRARCWNGSSARIPNISNGCASWSRSGQVEIVGGGFYEPILIAIPPEDRHAQITRLADYIEKHFERAAARSVACRARLGAADSFVLLRRRAWNTRWWTTTIFSARDSNSNNSTVIIMAEDQGHTVKVLPGLKALRYLIPFRDAERDYAISSRRRGRRTSGRRSRPWATTWKNSVSGPALTSIATRTDGSKNFFSALEKNSRLAGNLPLRRTRSPSRTPLGRADLPTASYTEMMEWALPTPARNRFHGLCEEFASRPECLPFLRGGDLAEFFHEILRVESAAEENAARFREGAQAGRYIRAATKSSRAALRRGADAAAAAASATTPTGMAFSADFIRRTCARRLWRSLIAAQKRSRIAGAPQEQYFTVSTKIDFDADGHEEIYFTSRPVRRARAAGRTAARFPRSIAGRASTALINSLMRRPEAYHDRLKNAPSKMTPGVQSIHDQMRVKEEGLERWLQLRPLAAACFPVLLFGREKKHQDCATARLDEDAAAGGGALPCGGFFEDARGHGIGGKRRLACRKDNFVRASARTDLPSPAKRRCAAPRPASASVTDRDRGGGEFPRAVGAGSLF